MYIKSIAYKLPSRVLDNDQLIEHIRRSNEDVDRKKLETYLTYSRKLLNKTGAKYRYWRAKNESARDLILRAMDEAFDKACINPQEIDVLIYCGVGRGFLEPANSYFYAKLRNLKKVNCFDITDACMSWIRALHMAYLMMKQGEVDKVMIINGEFNMESLSWRVRNLKNLEYSFPAYTIGEVATATILSSNDNEWDFKYLSAPMHADLCTVPLEGYKSFVGENQRIGLNGINGFVSYGNELNDVGFDLVGNLTRKYIGNYHEKQWYFPHTPSETAYVDGCKKLGIPLKKVFLDVYKNCGNLVSGGIPTGLGMAIEQNKLKRGDNIVFFPCSAGMVASLVQTTY
ncbi:3-oxoacyl-[acyl-carrier-protein] synthase III C-terminal domain-containing protein [Endozoicomonas atrinae]|uniref:3-oxoacyl-[acyl-carrier-protein] synthase III C-terminal domain-containing protein n=1 Tax=Endozoicomonas atrinae TaxID=1333660 RepID=UPI000A8C72FB|nr:3-oxoacyl-[acyl-carrier-protein] synthase III C-terminal domain-containing protein [Endozoicomonas atrinae]